MATFDSETYTMTLTASDMHDLIVAWSQVHRLVPDTDGLHNKVEEAGCVEHIRYEHAAHLPDVENAQLGQMAARIETLLTLVHELDPHFHDIADCQ